MQNKSCINHPTKERLILIRDWQIRACEGDYCAASLLSLFEYWHNIKLDKFYKNNSQSKKENDLLQWHTTEELKIGLLDLYSDKKIRIAIKFLEEVKFITVHRNPNKKFKYDQTKFFMFHPDEVNQWLVDNNYSTQSVKMPNGSGQNVINHPALMPNGFGKNNHIQSVKIPDQYTEITNKDYIQKNINNKFNKNNQKNVTVEQQRERFLDEEYLRLREKCGNENMPTSRCDEDYFAKFDRELREIQNKRGQY